jgi:hypothetical protein
MLTRADRFNEALPVWDLFLELPSSSRAEQVTTAKRAATLCRLQLSVAGAKTG